MKRELAACDFVRTVRMSGDAKQSRNTEKDCIEPKKKGPGAVGQPRTVVARKIVSRLDDIHAAAANASALR